MSSEAHWDRVWTLAQRGRGGVEPNPMVGALVVDAEGEVLGEGWHERFGGGHAEVNALERAAGRAAGRGADVRGGVMWVSLEPCAHWGKTPPCVEAIVAARIGRVEVGMVDPDPRVSGRGIERLREAGVEVVMAPPEVEARARRLNEGFIKRVTTGLPFVTLKWAQTLDGRIASRSGDSQWISSPASRRRVHELRGVVDAVMVGVGTAVADDPLLTARDVGEGGVRRVARRVVVDPTGRLPVGARMLNDGGAGVIVAVWEGVMGSERVKGLRERGGRGVEVVGLPRWEGEGGGGANGLESVGFEGVLDLEPLLRSLAEGGATHVLVEGGAGLAGTLLGQGLVDRVVVFVAAKVAGDEGAIPAVRGLAMETMGEARGLELVSAEVVEGGGGDVVLDYRVGG